MAAAAAGAHRWLSQLAAARRRRPWRTPPAAAAAVVVCLSLSPHLHAVCAGRQHGGRPRWHPRALATANRRATAAAGACFQLLPHQPAARAERQHGGGRRWRSPTAVAAGRCPTPPAAAAAADLCPWLPPRLGASRAGRLHGGCRRWRPSLASGSSCRHLSPLSSVVAVFLATRLASLVLRDTDWPHYLHSLSNWLSFMKICCLPTGWHRLFGRPLLQLELVRPSQRCLVGDD